MPSHTSSFGAVLRSNGPKTIFKKDKGSMSRFTFTIAEDSDCVLTTQTSGVRVISVNGREYTLTQLVDTAIALQSADLFETTVESLTSDIMDSSAQVPCNLAEGYFMVAANYAVGEKLNEVVVRQGDKVVAHIYVKHRPVLVAGDHFTFGKDEYVATQQVEFADELENMSAEATATAFIDKLVENGLIVKIRDKLRLKQNQMAHHLYKL